jgi:hypothetical protein
MGHVTSECDVWPAPRSSQCLHGFREGLQQFRQNFVTSATSKCTCTCTACADAISVRAKELPPRVCFDDGDPQHSNHDWGYLLYLPYFSVVGVHVARHDGMGYHQGTALNRTGISESTRRAPSCLLCPPSSPACVSADLLARDFACCRRARVESTVTSLPENVSCTLYRMTGQAKIFEIWLSGFNGCCTEGMWKHKCADEKPKS